MLSSLFLSLIRHVHSQTYYKNQVVNVQCAYHILAYKDWLMLWQILIIDFGKQGFFDWIIPATIYLEIRQTQKRHLAKIVDVSAQYCPNQRSQKSIPVLCSGWQQRIRNR